MISTSHDPFFNLATENWIFRDLDPAQKVLFLWRNEETVVIGRFQNPWVECHTKKMQEDGVHLARRQSGGGAVFHDLGNTNFTFLSSKAAFDKKTNNQIILNAIGQFGISAQASGRNDLVVEDSAGPRKISGSAFKETKDRAFHHGTLLIGADLTRLANYLNPDMKKLEAKGITSVKSRVANLSELNPAVSHQALSEKIIQSFFQVHGQECEVETLDNAVLKNIPSLQKYYEELKDWNWRFGETPQFSHHLSERFGWGAMDVHLDCHKGKITDAKIYSDSLHPEMVELITARLKNAEYTKASIEGAITAAKLELPMLQEYLEEFSAWLKLQIE